LMMRIAIHGTGRMAEAIATVVAGRDDVLVVALVGPNAPDWDQSLPWYPTLELIPEKPGLLIDFTLPEGTLAAAGWCARNGVPLLSGVTGLTASGIAALNDAATRVPVLWSPNLSLGVNLVADLAARAAAVLDDEIPVAIEDIHHQWKKDAPSGTALMLGQRISDARGGGGSRIEFSSVREGETIGEHSVTFHLAGEEFSLVHKAHDRTIYALGSLDAGAWLTAQAPGLYSAADWLSGRTRSRTES
jgi:4-hydroxy-tetrahydrodipicolinate reductase